jgi:hypothetical protein
MAPDNLVQPTQVVVVVLIHGRLITQVITEVLAVQA